MRKNKDCEKIEKMLWLLHYNIHALFAVVIALLGFISMFVMLYLNLRFIAGLFFILVILHSYYALTSAYKLKKINLKELENDSHDFEFFGND